MNWIKQMRTFYKLVELNSLSTNAQALYNYLLYKDNEFGWVNEFRLSNLSICGLTNLNKQALDRARNELIQKGYIKYTGGKNQHQCGEYKIIELNTVDSIYDIADNTADDTAGNTADDTAHDTAEAENTCESKETKGAKLNKTKLNNNTSSISDEEKEELLKHFDLIWQEYPNKKGKAKSLELYLQWIKGRKISGVTKKITDSQMYYAVKRYAKECEDNQTEQQFIKHGDTFFNKAILDYVEE